MISFNVYPLFTNPITIEKLEAINLARLLDNKKHTIELNVTKGTLLNSKILIHQPDTLKIKN
jgi:hypothetical protein